jgi:hypothetical protein
MPYVPASAKQWVHEYVAAARTLHSDPNANTRARLGDSVDDAWRRSLCSKMVAANAAWTAV